MSDYRVRQKLKAGYSPASANYYAKEDINEWEPHVNNKPVILQPDGGYRSRHTLEAWRTSKRAPKAMLPLRKYKSKY